MPSLSFSWILWRCSPRTEWYHRITWFPTWLSQLRQLYMADNNRGEEPDPANLRHAGARGRLWYRISLRWTTITWQLENEVRNESLIYDLVFFCCFSVDLFSLFLFQLLWLSHFERSLPAHLPPVNKKLTCGQQHISLNTYFLLKGKWHSVKEQ